MCQNPASANILSEYSKGKLGRLINNDMLHKTELYSTLSVYLENNGNITVTAEKLFIHPNTLRYRINKIEKLLKTDLSNFESIVELSIAYKIDQLLNSI
jgi:DNA-binding PucR family transcriptional regulator